MSFDSRGVDQANIYKMLMLAGFQAIVSVPSQKDINALNRRQNQLRRGTFTSVVTLDDELLAIGVTDQSEYYVIDRTEQTDVPWNEVIVQDGEDDDDTEFCEDGLGEAVVYAIFLVSKIRMNRAFIATSAAKAKQAAVQ